MPTSPGQTTPAWDIEPVLLELDRALATLRTPARLGISGPSCSGKTTLASEFASRTRAAGRNLAVVHADDFLRPASVHPRRQPPSLGYYEDAFNFKGFLDAVLKAGRPKPDVVIGEGEFILRNTLRATWDIAVWIEVSDGLMIERGELRDAAFFGSREKARSVYADVLVPANHLHRQNDRPQKTADIVLESLSDGLRLIRGLSAR